MTEHAQVHDTSKDSNKERNLGQWQSCLAHVVPLPAGLQALSPLRPTTWLPISLFETRRAEVPPFPTCPARNRHEAPMPNVDVRPNRSR